MSETLVLAGTSSPRNAVPRRANALEEMFGRQPTSAAELADPTPLLRNLAVGAVEVLLGEREPDQLARWTTSRVYEQLTRRFLVVARRNTEGRARAKRISVALGGVHLSSTIDGVVEAVAVVHTAGRSRAVAIRLEGLDHRWRATEIHVL